MMVLGPRPVAAGPREEIQLAADGSTESVAVPLRLTRATSPSKALERRRERRWIKAAQAGSDQALEHLYRRHWPWAHRAAYLVVHDAAAAEDIAQEAFLSAIRSLDRFDRARPFGPWLNRIVVNRAIDWARARSLRRETGADLDAAAPAIDPAAPESSSSVYSDEVVAALRQLSPEHRAVVVLRYLLDYTPGEISKALGLPRGTVNSRLRRALDRLGAEMEAGG
jgi:RNA polymerase sigma-70 factor (ECF subfamily)